MKLLHQCLVLGAIASLATSCSQEAPWKPGSGSGEGCINLKLSTLNDVNAVAPSVRAITTEVVTPPVADFKVKVTKLDGTYSQTFASVEEFVKKENFTVGSYEIEAWYGEPDAQGFIKEDGEGYEHAYYYGKTEDITVLESQTTEVELSASLANSMVVIEYTDAFKNYFVNWNTTLQTDANAPVSLGNAEGVSYVVPGNVKLTISAEMHNGKHITLTPGSFLTQAGYMYKMRYNIYNGEVGKVDQLVIEFDENLTTKPVVIDLSSELENTPAPKVTPEGFEHGAALVTQAGTPYKGEMKFNVAAAGKISSAVLTIKSDTYNPSYLTDGSIDLCAASDKQWADMQADGIKALGFAHNPGEMAQLDLTDLCRKLPDGVHNFSFQVTDKYSQSNEPIVVSLSCQPLDMKMVGEPAPFGEGYVDMIVTYNGPDPTLPDSNPFTFSVQDNNGYSESKIISIAKKDTRAYESNDYVYRIKVPDVDKDIFTVRGFFGEENGQDPDMTANVPFVYPEYKVLIDPMTKKLRIKADVSDPEKETLFFHKLRVFVDGIRLNETDTEKFLRDEPTDQLIVYNLESATQYNIKTTLYSDKNTQIFGTEDNVTTAPELPVPNGDFSQTAVTINESGVQVGGKYKVSPTTYTLKCNFNYSEPTGGWTSINQKTFYTNANPKNSWFTVASTFVDGSNVVIRTVGYNHNGAVPATSGGAFSTTYYCTNAPDDKSFTKASGELFLGSYSFNGTETRSYGVDFSGRPTSFSFDYQYTPDHDSSRGSMEIVIYAKDGKTVLNRRKVYIEAKATPANMKITFNRYPFGVEAGKLSIRFLSSDLEDGEEIGIHVPSGGELNQHLTLGNHTINQNDVKAVAIGSVLKVSNLKFDYGEKQNN